MASEADTSDSGFSDGSRSTLSEKTEKPRTKPRCKKCRNHNIDSPLNQHKRYCKFIYCTCRMCILTVTQRDIMARQTKYKRAQQEDENNGLPLDRRAPVDIAPVGIEPSKTVSRKRSLTPSSISSCETAESVIPMPLIGDDKRDMIYDAKRLIDNFRAPSSVLPIAFALMLQLEDYQKALEKIFEVEELLFEKARRQRFLMRDRPSVFATNPDYVPAAHSSSLRYSCYSTSPDSSGAIPLIYDKNKKVH